jgi:hypothetical protein
LKEINWKEIKDILSTFGDPDLAAMVMLELGYHQMYEKGLAGTKPVLTGNQYWSLVLGEWVISHLGIGVIIASRLNQEQGVKPREATQQVAREIISISDGYYYDHEEGKPKSYLYPMIRKVVDKMIGWNLIDVQSGKYFRPEFENVDFVSKFYGGSTTCGTGRSSLYRALVGAVIGETPGIDTTFVHQRLRDIHHAKKVEKKHVKKVLNIHGAAGTCFILQDKTHRLYRTYERTNQIPSSTPSILKENPDVVGLLLRSPCVSEKVIYEIFGASVAQQLRLETSSITPNLAKKIVVRIGGDMYVLGDHVRMMKLRKCAPEKNPALRIIRDLYESFSAGDCATVAMFARQLLHELLATGQFKPVSPTERRILMFFEKRNIVEGDPFGGDIWTVKNLSMVQLLSVTLGNVLDKLGDNCGGYSD